METFSSAETPTRGRGLSPSASYSSTGGPQTPSSASAFRIPFSGDGDENLEAELSQLLQEHAALEREASRKNRKIKQLTENAVKVQSEAEIEEEKITNRLLKRLEKAKRNKVSIEERLRREMKEKAEVTSQIASVQASLVELENQIETEQNCILHKLQRELIEVSAMKANVQRALHAERGKYLMFMREAIDSVVANMNSKHNKADGNGDATHETTMSNATDGTKSKKEGEEMCSPPYSPLSPDNHPHLQYPPTGGPLPPSAASVAVLQNELNTLLNDHFASEQALAEDTMVSDLLAQMLGRVHNEVAMERDRLSLMESELQRARAEVAIAERSSVGILRGGRGGGGGGAGEHRNVSANLENNKNDIQNYENETPLRRQNERLGGDGEADAEATESESASTATTPAAGTFVGTESVAKTHSFRGRGGGGVWPTVPGASMSLNNTSQLIMNSFVSGGGVSESGLGAAVAPSFSLLRRLQESMGGGTSGALGFSATESEDGDVSTCSSYVLPTPFASASVGAVGGLSSSARHLQHGGIGPDGGATGGASGQQPLTNPVSNPPPRPQSRMPPFTSASLAQQQHQQCPSPSSFSNNSRHARAVSLTGLSHPRGPSASNTPNAASSLFLPANQSAGGVGTGGVSSGGPLLTPIGHGHGNPIFSSSCHSVSVRSPSVSSAASCSSAAVMRNHTHQVLATALSSTPTVGGIGGLGRDKDRENTARTEQ